MIMEMLVSVSPGGSNLFSLAGRPHQLLVGTVGGVICMEARAGSDEWKIVSRSVSDCHIHALLVEPINSLVFAGVHNGTVYASNDAGRSWERRDKGINQANVYTLSAARSNGGVLVYAGTEPAHLFVSDDLGEGWQELASLREVPSAIKWNYPQPPNIGHVKQISFDPRNSETIYVCIEQGALLRSRDAGLSWEELHGFYLDVHRLAVVGSNSLKMYLACGDGVYRTIDGGATWKQLTYRTSGIGYPDGLVVHPEDENLLFISGAGSIPPTWAKSGTANSSVGRSRDGGLTWQFLKTGFPADYRGNIEALTLACCGSSSFLFAGTTEGDVFLSEDEGESWSRIASRLPPIAKRRHHLYMQSGR
jgi:photosystem II stability/assembly factor-like uncharacterized protein